MSIIIDEEPCAAVVASAQETLRARFDRLMAIERRVAMGAENFVGTLVSDWLERGERCFQHRFFPPANDSSCNLFRE